MKSVLASSAVTIAAGASHSPPSLGTLAGEPAEQAAIPKAQALVALIDKNQAVFQQILALSKDLLPVIDMALTVIKDKRT